MIRLALILAALALSGCGRHVLVKPEPVEVVREVRVPIEPALLAPCVVNEPDPACWRGTLRAFCNGQLATMLADYRHALALCNADKAAIGGGK